LQEEGADSLSNLRAELTDTDRSLVAALVRDPRAGVTALARITGLARNTVAARLQRMEDAGVITGYGPEINPRRAGFDVLAFSTITIAQGAHNKTIAALVEIPEIVEIHTTTGAGDLLVKVLARTNDDLHDILQRLTALASVVRCDTQLALHTTPTGSVASLVAAG